KMAETIRILVLLAEHADPLRVEEALDGDSFVEVVGYCDYLEEWREFLEQPADLVVVVASGDHANGADMVDRAVKHRPDRPVRVRTDTPAKGFLRQMFEAGADDVITLPQSPQEVEFNLQKVIARRNGLTIPGRATASLIPILGPKGGTGKTLVAT